MKMRFTAHGTRSTEEMKKRRKAHGGIVLGVPQLQVVAGYLLDYAEISSNMQLKCILDGF
jgi:hypothetical protein